ncbi:MAG: hypothetical protein KUG81_10410, partial [Gammaproteobacteria bacterium]|nr:hypothetical protein [Gammaproteobacteria bacterium]
MHRPTRSRAGLTGALFSFLALGTPALATPTAQARDSVTSQPIVCGTPDRNDATGSFFAGSPSDCGYSSNTADSQYDPNFVMEIPVIWHVITRLNGTEDVSDTRINNQMAHMNQAYGGTLHANGNESNIRFVLASVDPNGQPA